MHLEIRAIDHTADEIKMGNVVWYKPLSDADGVSVTANSKGFTTLAAVARCWDIPLEHVNKLADHANSLRNKYPWTLLIEEPIRRSLIVIPRVQEMHEIEAMTLKLLQDAEGEKVQHLELTHFHFIQTQFPFDEIATVFRIINAWNTTVGPKRITFDIDSRHTYNLSQLMGAPDAAIV